MPGVINDPAIAMYVAAAVALVVMIGFFIYLWRVDRQVRTLQQQLDRNEQVSRAQVERSSEPLRPQRLEKELSDGFNRR